MRHARGKVTNRKMRLSRSVVFRQRKQKRRTGRYNACVQREKGFADSGRRWPLIKMTIRTGTNVMARMDEKATESVFVQARGRNILPSCASRRKTGRNETRMTRSEKKIAGPTCFAPPMRMVFLS